MVVKRMDPMGEDRESQHKDREYGTVTNGRDTFQRLPYGNQ